jgi:hypothetical protein
MFGGFSLSNHCKAFSQFVLNKWNKVRSCASLGCRGCGCPISEKSVIHLRKNESFHSRSKHIEEHYTWIQDVLKSKQMKIEKVHRDDNGADMLTKVVTRAKLHVCCRLVGMTAARQWDPSWCQEGKLVGICPSTWRCVGSPTSAHKFQHVSNVDQGSHPTDELPLWEVKGENYVRVSKKQARNVFAAVRGWENTLEHQKRGRRMRGDFCPVF